MPRLDQRDIELIAAAVARRLQAGPDSARESVEKDMQQWNRQDFSDPTSTGIDGASSSEVAARALLNRLQASISRKPQSPPATRKRKPSE